VRSVVSKWCGQGRRESGRLRAALETFAFARLAGIVAAGLAVAGCASAGNPVTLFADPGKYQFHSCEQIAGQRKHWAGREQELRRLMDKAGESTGGTVVNLLAYKADHVAASEELEVLEATARSKGCDTPANLGSSSAVR
jgi:hypothetical protein